MNVLILGAAGMIGRKLSERIASDGGIGGNRVEELLLADVVEPQAIPGRVKVRTLAVDIAAPGASTALVAEEPEIIFHLAAVVSGEAEADFEKGYRTNLDGTRELFEAIRAQHDASNYSPRVVFASSIAVFGAPFPPRIHDEFASTPLTSYGTQKAICELLLADYSRRGIFDGIGLRLPTICIRPGKPNKAASGFFSSILREPMAGQEAVLPVAEDVRHYFASPRAAVGSLLHAATLDGRVIGARRNFNLPGLSATVGEQISALRRIVGDKAAVLIRREPDPAIARIVSGWAQDIDARRARELGFVAETSFDEIIRAHLEDELGGSPRI